MRIFLAFYLLFSWSSLPAEEGVTGSVSISEDYNSGSYLIYNCLDQYWVCVTEEEFNRCHKEREKEIVNSRPRSSCAPVKKFLTNRSCFERQLYLVSQNYGDRICVLDEWRLKEI